MDSLAYLLALNHAPGVGPATISKLLQHFDDAQQIFDNVADLQQIGLKKDTLGYLKSPNWAAVDRELSWAQAPQHHIIPQGHVDYPELLAQTDAAPPLLYIQGDSSILKQKQLAMVGARNPTPQGAEAAFAFARTIVERGWHVTSGLALGIDSQSHKGAIHGGGKTIAVLGTGPDQIYPKSNKALAESLLQCGGALVTEFPLGTVISKSNFPRRNRIISGLSYGCFVVEAAPQSGSLITARYALEQNRDVFAMPGSIHNPLAKGCHALIKRGAKLVESVEDIWDELLPYLKVKQNEQAANQQKLPVGEEKLSPDQSEILHAIDYSSTSVDSIVERTGLSTQTVTSNVLVLELQGYIHALAGGNYSR